MGYDVAFGLILPSFKDSELKERKIEERLSWMYQYIAGQSVWGKHRARFGTEWKSFVFLTAFPLHWCWNRLELKNTFEHFCWGRLLMERFPGNGHASAHRWSLVSWGSGVATLWCLDLVDFPVGEHSPPFGHSSSSLPFPSLLLPWLFYNSLLN